MLTALEAVSGGLVTVRTASERTGIPRRTLYHWIRKGKIESVSIDGTLFVTESHLIAMVRDDF